MVNSFHILERQPAIISLLLSLFKAVEYVTCIRSLSTSSWSVFVISFPLITYEFKFQQICTRKSFNRQEECTPRPEMVYRLHSFIIFPQYLKKLAITRIYELPSGWMAITMQLLCRRVDVMYEKKTVDD